MHECRHFSASHRYSGAKKKAEHLAVSEAGVVGRINCQRTGGSIKGSAKTSLDAEPFGSISCNGQIESIIVAWFRCIPYAKESVIATNIRISAENFHSRKFICGHSHYGKTQQNYCKKQKLSHQWSPYTFWLYHQITIFVARDS
jgi:hypothetical protein